MNNTILRLALIGGAALAVSGCSTDGYGGYGYGGLSYGYASPYYGWYDDYYYPGTGYYVYERSGGRHRWSDHQRRYWQSHRSGSHRDNWSGYQGAHGSDGGTYSGHHRSGDHRSGGARSGGNRSHDGGRAWRGSGGGNRSGDSDGHRHHH